MYPQQIRTEVLSRILGGEISLAQAEVSYGISHSTLKGWRRRALLEAGDNPRVPSRNKEIPVPSKLSLPPGVSFLEAHAAVTLRAALPPEQFGEYCRAHGLHAEAIAEWAEWFKVNPEAMSMSQVREIQAENRHFKAENRHFKAQNARLTKDIHRKDKSLAEYATLLAISKKARAIWGSMDEESAPASQTAEKS